MKIKLSKFIKKAEMASNHPNVVQMVNSLKVVLRNKGDIQIDLEHMCQLLGVKIED
jgi:hypothetical protein